MKLFVALLLAWAPIAMADTDFPPTGAPVFEDQATTSLKVTPVEHGLQYDQTEVNYVQGVYGSDEIYKSTNVTTWWNFLDGLRETTTVQAYKLTNQKFETTWAFEATGSDFEVLNEELGQTTESGCCGSPNIGHIYRLADGAPLISQYWSSLHIVTVPNADVKPRYLAQTQDNDAPETNDGYTHIGTISYFQGTGVVRAVRIYTQLPEGWGTELTELKAVVSGKNSVTTYSPPQIELWESDGQADPVAAFKGFGIEGKLYVDDRVETFKVIIDQDTISERKSKFSRGLKAVFVNP